ncbi:MAG TPA: hypothetical protein VJ821_18430 [Anaerolineales bacterium]|nr:hypothetical protein [Anaerolineales bacterium]
MAKFGCSEGKMLTEDAQHTPRRAIAQGALVFIVRLRDRAKLSESAEEKVQ